MTNFKITDVPSSQETSPAPVSHCHLDRKLVGSSRPIRSKQLLRTGDLWSETSAMRAITIEPSAYDGDNDGCIAVNDLLIVECVRLWPVGNTIYWFKNAPGWPSVTGNWTDEARSFTYKIAALTAVIS